MIICWAMRSRAGRRSRNVRGCENKEQRDADISGQVSPKPGLGRLPNKQIFAFWPEGRNVKIATVWPQLPCLPFSDTPENGAKKQRLLLLNLRFSGFLEPFGCSLHDNKLFFVHGV